MTNECLNYFSYDFPGLDWSVFRIEKGSQLRILEIRQRLSGGATKLRGMFIMPYLLSSFPLFVSTE